MRTLLIALIVAGGAVWAYVAYWEKQLAPITAEPAAKIVPVYFEPVPITWPVRHLDLGYVRFDVPATLTNPLARVGKAALTFASLTGVPSEGAGFIMQPVYSDADELLKSFEPLADRKYDSFFQLRKHALDTQPPSVWTAFSAGGRKQVFRDLSLVMIKVTMSGDGEVRIAENEQIGLIITEHGSTVLLDFYDKKSRHVQIMGFEKTLPGVNLEEVISSIFHTYRSSVVDFSEYSFGKALEKAGYLATSPMQPAQ